MLIRKQFLSNFFTRVHRTLVLSLLLQSTILLAQPENALDFQSVLADQKFQELFAKQQPLQLSGNSVQDKKVLQEQRRARINFYKDYLAKYYPKVFAIRVNFFMTMKPAEIEKALKDIVDLLTKQPWFYIVDKASDCKIIYYWEYILDQLRIFHDFISQALVDQKTGLVFLPEDYDVDKVLDSESFFDSGSSFLGSMREKSTEDKKKLADELLEHGTALYDFYALCFDYMIKLFNEKILCEELWEANMFINELEECVSKLQGSLYEVAYQEHLKTAKELLVLLKESREQSSDRNSKARGLNTRSARAGG